MDGRFSLSQWAYYIMYMQLISDIGSYMSSVQLYVILKEKHSNYSSRYMIGNALSLQKIHREEHVFVYNCYRITCPTCLQHYMKVISD